MKEVNDPDKPISQHCNDYPSLSVCHKSIANAGHLAAPKILGHIINRLRRDLVEVSGDLEEEFSALVAIGDAVGIPGIILTELQVRNHLGLETILLLMIITAS